MSIDLEIADELGECLVRNRNRRQDCPNGSHSHELRSSVFRAEFRRRLLRVRFFRSEPPTLRQLMQWHSVPHRKNYLVRRKKVVTLPPVLAKKLLIIALAPVEFLAAS
jgi:hypothetical protein